MRFHGLMLLRDESDIIQQNLDHLLTWVDSLFILDMGSVDGTWDIVQDYARRDSRIVPFFSKPIVYDDNLRSMIFNEYRSRFDPGDWVLKIDADEFYHLTPPDFVRTRMRPTETAVLLQWYFFRLTQAELTDYESGRVDIQQDRTRSITDRRRFYKISQYFEPRMFRYRRDMQWPHNVSFPYNAGYVSRQRIPIRHYPHRDPLQLQRRFALRAAMMKQKAHAGGHWNNEDWRNEILDANGQSISSRQGGKVGLASQAGIDTGPLYHWQPGTALVEQPLQNHIPPFTRRTAQRIVHPLLLPLLDRKRPRYDSSFQPTPFPADLNNRIYAAGD
jgi:hypothetical protein